MGYAEDAMTQLHGWSLTESLTSFPTVLNNISPWSVDSERGTRGGFPVRYNGEAQFETLTRTDGLSACMLLNRLESVRIDALGEWIVQVSVNAGWVPPSRVEERSFGDLMALLHSEVSEALEEYRNGHGYREKYYKEVGPGKPPKPEGIPIELADVAIRLFYTARIYGIPLEPNVIEKIIFNETRDKRHGEGIVGADGKRL